MVEITTEYTLERYNGEEYESFDLEVTFDLSEHVPAVYHGPAAGPAEGGEIELGRVTLCGEKAEFALTPEEETALIDWIADQDWSDEMSPDPDDAYDKWRDNQDD